MAGTEMKRPFLAFDLLKHAASHILFVPPRVHQNAFGTWFQSSTEIVLIPIPALLPHRFAIGVLAGAKQVITDTQICTKPRDASASPNPVILASTFERPTCCGLAVL